jgi:hypothetical protein
MKFKIPLSLSFYILLFSTCTIQEVDNGLAVFEGIVVAEFMDSETGEPVTGKRWLLSVVQENFADEQPVSIGVSTTDEEGMITRSVHVPVSNNVIKVIFTSEDEEELTVEQEVELELRLEEPFDSVHLQFSI